MKREPLKDRFRRARSRWRKILKNENFSAEDFSRMTMNLYSSEPLGSGLRITAQRNDAGKWDIVEEETGIFLACCKRKTAGGLTFAQALDHFQEKYPQGMHDRFRGVDHPYYVARQTGHVFSVAPPPEKKEETARRRPFTF